MSKLEIHHLTYTYHEGLQRLTALDDVNLAIAQGEFVSLIGPSGSGKSTLLQIIAGLLQPNTGTVLLEGKPQRHRLGSTAYMPQLDALLPWRTILDNIVLGAEIRGGGRAKTKRRALELLPLFGLEGFAHSFPVQLSGGMRQRAALLRTFLSGQDILLLDEPFGALDALTRRDLQRWLLEVWAHFRYTILFVTHDVQEALFLSDRVLVLSKRPGKIIHEVPVPLSRPRSHDVDLTTPEIVALEKTLFQSLKG